MMVHTGYHPLKHRPLSVGSSGYHPLKHRPLEDSVWMVHTGYHPLKHRPLRIVWDIILLSIVLLGECLDGAQWISSSENKHRHGS